MLRAPAIDLGPNLVLGRWGNLHSPKGAMYEDEHGSGESVISGRMRR